MEQQQQQQQHQAQNMLAFAFAYGKFLYEQGQVLPKLTPDEERKKRHRVACSKYREKIKGKAKKKKKEEVKHEFSNAEDKLEQAASESIIALRKCNGIKPSEEDENKTGSAHLEAPDDPIPAKYPRPDLVQISRVASTQRMSESVLRNVRHADFRKKKELSAQSPKKSRRLAADSEQHTGSRFDRGDSCCPVETTPLSNGVDQSDAGNKNSVEKSLSSAGTDFRSLEMDQKQKPNMVPLEEGPYSDRDPSNMAACPPDHTSGMTTPPALLDENSVGLARNDQDQLSVSLHPPILQLHMEEMARFAELFPVDSGCVIKLNLTKPLPIDSREKKVVQQMLHKYLEEWGPKQWDGLVQQWKEAPRDSSVDIQKALQRYLVLRKAYPKLAGFGGDEELLWWRHGVGRNALRNLAKLRRLVSKITVTIACRGRVCHVQKVEVSLADVLLRYSSVRDDLLDLLLGHAARVHTWSTGCAGSVDILAKYESLRRTLYCTLHRFGGTHLFRGKQLVLSRLQASDLIESGHGPVNRRSYIENTKLELIEIRKKRRELFERFGNHQVEHPGRLLEEFILLTEREDGVSEEEFLKETAFMSSVNKTLVRPFDPFKSFPRMAQIQLCRDEVNKLRNILFDVNGSLSRRCASDALLSSKHYYINFTNPSNAGRNDKRWQIPIRLHGQKPVDTRVKVETLLSSAGALDLRHEETKEIGILVGGTEDQSLHHDMARELTAWLPESSGLVEDAVVGWETSRLWYNSAMSGEHPPRAMIIGLGESDSILLGVQKNQIQRNVGGRSDRCRIIHGRQYEDFQIIRENRHLAVLEAKMGCVFTGDFPHAGVRNVEPNSTEDDLMEELYRRIDAILEQEPDGVEGTRLVLDMLCAFKGLNRLCRFYCATKPVKSSLRIPENMIGYSECSSNCPNSC